MAFAMLWWVSNTLFCQGKHVKLDQFYTVRHLFGCTCVGVLLLGGCASQPMITQQTTRTITSVPEFYTVQRGDSLGQIANRYGLDYQHVAALNGINPTAPIYVSQSLRLRSSDGQSAGGNSMVQTTPLSSDQQIHTQSLPLNNNSASTTDTTPPVSSNAQVGLGSAMPSATQPSRRAENGTWVMPSQGPIISHFNLAKNLKGLQFGGNIGDPVYAASSGEVVYADDGLKEYGNLVLIKHDNGYITAYAHNSKMLVKVKQHVSVGQKIAEMGNTGTNKTMLEFQIRLDGKPVDPVKILPIS